MTDAELRAVEEVIAHLREGVPLHDVAPGLDPSLVELAALLAGDLAETGWGSTPAVPAGFDAVWQSVAALGGVGASGAAAGAAGGGSAGGAAGGGTAGGATTGGTAAGGASAAGGAAGVSGTSGLLGGIAGVVGGLGATTTAVIAGAALATAVIAGVALSGSDDGPSGLMEPGETTEPDDVGEPDLSDSLWGAPSSDASTGDAAPDEDAAPGEDGIPTPLPDDDPIPAEPEEGAAADPGEPPLLPSDPDPAPQDPAPEASDPPAAPGDDADPGPPASPEPPSTPGPPSTPEPPASPGPPEPPASPGPPSTPGPPSDPPGDPDPGPPSDPPGDPDPDPPGDPDPDPPGDPDPDPPDDPDPDPPDDPDPDPDPPLPPVVRSDAVTNVSGESATFDIFGQDGGEPYVTVGDEPLDVDSLTVVDAPEHGTADVVDGRIVYTPAPFWLDDESFTYEVCDTSGDPDGCAQGSLEVTTTRRVETFEQHLPTGLPVYLFSFAAHRNFDTATFPDVTVCPDADADTCLVTRLGPNWWQWWGPPGQVPGGYPFVLVVHIDSWAEGDGRPGPTGVRYELRIRFTHQSGGGAPT